MGDLTEAVTSAPSSNNNNSNSGGAAPSPNPRPLPIREDCWSEEATSTLVDAWGSRFMELNRGNLRQKDWQDVADAVNALHGHTKKTHRTDVQCKNRIDTIKKKYKVEKARVVSSNGALASTWPFFERMDSLIGSSFSGKKPPEPSASVSASPPVALPIRRSPAPGGGGGIAALPQKRPAPGDDGGFLRRNYSAMAAAAAAASAYSDSEEEEGEDEDEEMEEEEGIGVERGSGGGGGGGGGEGGEGMRRLAQAIERFGEVYEKVEREKLRHMVDLEKQRMKFAKDLEMERMRIFTETQIQLEKIKKGSGAGGGKIQQQQHHHRSAAGSNGEREY